MSKAIVFRGLFSHHEVHLSSLPTLKMGHSGPGPGIETSVSSHVLLKGEQLLIELIQVIMSPEQ